MPTQSDFGNTVFLESLDPGATAERLTRFSFSKDSSDTNYDESWLQKLITQHPGLLPVAQVEPAFDSMVAVCQELKLKDGFVDNIFVTPTGNIAIVECKLWRNPEARRKVIAQIINYASEMSRLSYEEFEAAVKHALWKAPGKSLFDMVCKGPEQDEALFHDAVTRNLRRGRFLLIIVGDGIREGLESMAEFLQQHAGLHFTFCLVELTLFKLPNEGGIIAQPRIIGRTTNIERGVFVIANGHTEDRPAPPPSLSPTRSISLQTFYETLDAKVPSTSTKLQKLLATLDEQNLSIKPDLTGKTLTLRWFTDSVNWNLGTIVGDGLMWMEYHGQQALNANLSAESRTYLETLASISPEVQAYQTGAAKYWNLRSLSGGSPRVADLLTETGIKTWASAIRQFQLDVQSKDAD